ncbi:hypothetical protein O6H91_08G065200 [Diphasiastrum complanatum]|uniref:Uncharacterized protein n=1 Tax=Diphasiastrum complanatum TaxID=34168 RepID=A0ACC2CYB2_DIPCM|nr:hypothetical protein O6H91_08G065200 [Diphasiastrum complanatum]
MAEAFLRYLGCVDLQNLGVIGASTPGWLDNHSLLASMKLDCIALARTRTLVIAGLSGMAGSSDPTPATNFITVPTSEAEDKVTAIQWLVWGGWSVLAVGMNSGVLLTFSPSGSLLTKQNFNAGPILQLRLRSGRKIYSSEDASEELTVVLGRSLVRLDGLDLQSQLRRRLLETEKYRGRALSRRVQSESQETEADFGRLSYQIWNISKSSSSSACADAAITGLMSPTLFEQQTSQRYFCAVTVGTDSAMTAFR